MTSAFVSDYLSENDQLMARAINLGVLEQQRGQAELMNEVPNLLAAVTVDDVAEVAVDLARPEASCGPRVAAGPMTLQATSRRTPRRR